MRVNAEDRFLAPSRQVFTSAAGLTAGCEAKATKSFHCEATNITLRAVRLCDVVPFDRFLQPSSTMLINDSLAPAKSKYRLGALRTLAQAVPIHGQWLSGGRAAGTRKDANVAVPAVCSHRRREWIRIE
jgi:hypothetical protein